MENPMKASPAVHGAARLLEIRTVEVITGRGRSVTLSSVRCPVRGKSAAVEECADCTESEGVAQDVLSRGEWLCCRTEASEEPARGMGPPVRELMRRTSVAVRSSLSTATAATALRARGQAAAPVVDGEGRPVGFVEEAELLRARPGSKVADAMTRVALSVTEGAPVSRAAGLLAQHGVEWVAVVSGDGAVVGVLSALDVVTWLATPGGPLGVEGAGAPQDGG
jgi:CBS domain-containing protein